MTGKRKTYWDTACWLAWLNDERCWPNDVILGIQDLVVEVETNQGLLFTSALTRSEIFFGKLDLDQKSKYAKLMRRRNVLEYSADPRIMDRASQIREYHQAKGQTVWTQDAIHLATAILYGADEFQTMDGLQKGGSKKRGLLKLNGNVGGYTLNIVQPYRRNLPPSSLVKVPQGPLFAELAEGDDDESK